MTKKRALEGFIYHGERIYSPLGNRSTYHERMREMYAHIHDTGHCRKIPNDPLEADRVLEQGCPVCGYRPD